MRTGSKVSAPPTAQKEIQFEIFQHFAPRASVLIITLHSCLLPPPPLLPPTLCFPSFFLISLYLLSHLTLPPFSPLFCSAKRLPLCSEDETESVGLIIPDQSFASTSLPALLGSSWSAMPSEITSRRGPHS